MNQDLQNYIKQMREQGYSDEQIKGELKKIGWKEEQINAEFQQKIVLAKPKIGKNDNKDSLLDKFKTKTFLISMGIIFLFVFIGGIFAVLYTQVWNPEWNPFRLSPQQIITEMVSGNKNIDYFELKTSTEFMSEIDGNMELLLKVETDELIDESNPVLPKSRGRVVVTGKEAEDIFSLHGINEVETIFIGANFYVGSNNSWIQFGSWSPIYSLLIPDDPLYSKGPELWFGDPELYIVEEEFFNEQLDYISVYHYKLRINPITYLKIDLSLSAEDLPSSINAELWIDKKSKRLLQSIFILENKENKLNSKIRFSYPESLDQSIEAPTIKDIYDPYNIFGTEDVRSKARDVENVGKIRNAQLALELYFDDKGRYPSDADVDDLTVVNTCVNADDDSVANEVMDVIGMIGVQDSATGASYFYGANADPATNYVLRTTLENSNDPVLDVDIDGENIFGCDCDDPFYCVTF